jgi:type IV secretion system protein TrbL
MATRRIQFIILLIVLSLTMLSHGYAQEGATFVDALTTQYSDSALSWIPSIQDHAESLFWLLASIACVWTFIVLTLRHSDLADFVGAAIRFIFITMFFYWLLDHGPTFAAKILASTLQLASDATQMKGAGWSDFVNLGVQIFIQAAKAGSLWTPVQSAIVCTVGLLTMISLGLITVSLILVNCETYVKLAAGVIFLGFGSAEWTRDLTINYFRALLAVGIKQFVMLLMAGIGLDIMQSILGRQAQAGAGIDLQGMAVALISSVILLALIAKVPASVAAIVGVESGAFGGWGFGTVTSGAVVAAQVASAAGGAAVGGGKALGSAVRNAVRRGQELSRGKS